MFLNYKHIIVSFYLIKVIFASNMLYFDGTPMTNHGRVRIRMQDPSCSGSKNKDTDLYLKGPQTCSFIVNPHWHTDKDQNNERVYFSLGQLNPINGILQTEKNTIVVSDVKKTCYSSPAHDIDHALADLVIAILNAIKGGGVITDKFFYAISTSHGENGIDMHRQRQGGNVKYLSFEYRGVVNGKHSYNMVSSEHGRRKFLYRCNGDNTAWTSNFNDQTSVYFIKE